MHFIDPTAREDPLMDRAARCIDRVITALNRALPAGWQAAIKPRWLCMMLAGAVAALPPGARAAGAEFTIEAADFDGGNVRVSLAGQPYADGPSCVWNAGELPNWVEYEIEFPVSAEYTLSALYSAAQPRPVEICLDEQIVHTGFNGVTGSWNTTSARWEEQCRLPITRGRQIIQLRREGPFPHICGLRLKASVPFPEGWRLPRPTPEQRAERMQRALRRAQIKAEIAALESVDLEAVRLAIEDMETEFPGQYDGVKHRQAVARFELQRAALLKRLAGNEAGPPESVEQVLAGIRDALLANPLLDFDRLLVVRRNFAGNRARQVVSSDAGFVAHNYQNHTSLARGGWDNEIAVLQRSGCRLRHAPSVRSSAGRGIRHGAAQPDGVPRVDQPADPDAGEGASRGEAGRAEPPVAGAALRVDRPERAPRRQLESTPLPRARSAQAALRTGRSAGRQRR